MSLRGLVTTTASAALIALCALPACQNTAGVSEVFTSLDGTGARRRSTFYTDTKEIHCIAKAMFGRPDVTIRGVFRRKAEYNFETDALEKVDVYEAGLDVRPDVSAGQKEPSIIDFALVRPPATSGADAVPYVAGEYTCEVEIDGEVIDKSADFNIEIPTCPEATITPTSPCVGFFRLDTECPRYGIKSGEADSCVCKQAGWECDTREE